MIQVVNRAIDILDFVSEHGKEPVQLIKIAAHVGINEPTCANIVKTLVDKNYLENVGRKKGYRLGFGAYKLSGNASYQEDLIDAAKGPMISFTKEINESILLGTIKNYKRLLLHIEECDQVLQVKTTLLADVFRASSGRLLLSFLTEKELNKLIRAIGLPPATVWPEAQTRETLQAELNKIKADEFVIIRTHHHAVCMAVPVYKNNVVVAGLSIFVPESRCTEKKLEDLERLIKLTAQKINTQLEQG